MSEFILKTFHKHKAIKVIYVGVDKKVKIYWTLPYENRVKIEDKTYLLAPEKIFIHQGVSTIFVNYLNAEPLDIAKVNYKVFTPDKFDKAIGSKVVEDLIKANKPKESLNLSMVLSGLVLLAIVYLYFTFNSQLDGIKEALETLTTLNGGV